MARHHPDLVMCRKQPGIGAGGCKVAIQLHQPPPSQLLDAFASAVRRALTQQWLASTYDHKPPTQAMASVSSATPTCDQPPSCVYVMSATTAPMLGVASSVVALACRMHTTARSAHSWRKMYERGCAADVFSRCVYSMHSPPTHSGTGVQRLSTWVPPERICFTSAKSGIFNGHSSSHPSVTSSSPCQ